MNKVRINESGYKIKQCPECKTDININSFNGDICNICADNKIVKIWEVTEGDFNDVFGKTVLKGNTNQIDEYLKSQFSDEGKEKMESIDNIGYAVYYDEEIDPETNEPYEDQEVRIEYYIIAEELENYDYKYHGNIEIDLTKDNIQEVRLA